MISAKRNIRLLNVLAFFGSFRAYEGVMVVYFAMISESFTVGMTVLAVMHISSSIFEIPTGVLSDKIGRKQTMLLYYISGALAITCYFVADSSMWLMIGAVIMGFSLAVRSGSVHAYIYENLELLGRTDDFKKIEGKRRAIGRYSLLVAGFVGSGIIYLYDIHTAILVTIVMLLISAGIAFFLHDIEDPEPNKTNIYAYITEAWKNFKKDVTLRDLGLGSMLAQGIGNSEYRFRSLYYALFMPEWLVNLMATLNHLCYGVGLQIAHWLVRKIGFLRALVHATMFSHITIGVLAFFQNTISGSVMTMISGSSTGVREIAKDDLLQDRYSKKERATMGSLIGLGGSIIYSICAITMGMLADYVGIVYTVVLMQVLMLVSASFFYKGIKSGRY